MATIPITKRGAEKLKEELHRLKTVERPAVITAIAEARAQGDLSENADYDAAKDRQGFVEGRIQEIEGKLSVAQVIDPSGVDGGGKVVFGATVELEDEDSGDTVKYQIVGEDEADLKQGLINISSPIARALIGKEEGDTAEVQAPGGIRRYEVVALRDTELLCLPSATFHTLFASSIGFNQFLVGCMNLRLSQAMAMIEAGRTRSPEQRIALSLSRLFWNRTRQLDLTQDELASLAGMSRQTANRVLNALQQQGVISLSMNRIRVLDDAALTRLLE